MANANITKKVMSEALIELTSEKSFDKIGVNDICEKCHMNRGGFYYHFKDKNELVDWIFISDFYDPIFHKNKEYKRSIFLMEMINYFDAHRSIKLYLNIKGRIAFQSRCTILFVH